ncbi:MAG: ABC transporter substrate-binding protein [Anaerolineales bacterium]|nr:ABC transporter substrate-binding protein [Anaerolineales bacterium]
MAMKNKILPCILVISLLTACAPAQAASQAQSPLRIEYTLWWGDYTLLVAKELGLFEKYGVTVEPVYYPIYSDSYADLAAGILDGALFGLDDAISTNDKTPLKIVAVNDDGGFYYLLGDENTHDLASLKGKKVATEIGTFGEFLLLQALNQAGLTSQDVTMLNIPAEEVPENLGSLVDAGYTWDPYAAQALAAGAHTLYQSGGSQSIIPDVIVFNAKITEERPQDVRAFLKAWFEAVDFRKANPEQANEIIAAQTGYAPEDITVDAQIYTLQENIVLFSDTVPDNLISLKNSYQANSEFLLNLGVLRNPPSFEQFINSSFLFP